MRNPTIRGKGADIFFPENKVKPVENENSRTVEKKKTRKIEAVSIPSPVSRQLWKPDDKTQISMWLSKELVKKLKFKSIEENKKFSAIVEELLKKGL